MVVPNSNKIHDYHKLCDKAKKVDSKIRFAGIINERGRLVAGGISEGVKSVSSDRDDEMIFMELAMRVKMRREFDKQLGEVKFAMALRKNALAMSFPVGTDTLYVYAEHDADYSKLSKKIMKIIQKN